MLRARIESLHRVESNELGWLELTPLVILLGIERVTVQLNYLLIILYQMNTYLRIASMKC